MKERRFLMRAAVLVLCLVMLPAAVFATTAAEDAVPREDSAQASSNGSVTLQTPASSPGPAPVQTPELLQDGHAEGELLVLFQEGTSGEEARDVIHAQESTCEELSTVNGSKMARISVEDGEDALEETLQSLAENPRVESVQPNYRYLVCGKADPYLQKKTESGRYQYQLETVHAQEAWTLLEKNHKPGKSGGTIVAALDTGLDTRHEDLQANRRKTKDSGAGFVYMRNGKPVSRLDDMDAAAGHGTHVAGIIGATYGNGKGGSGIAAGHHNDLVQLLMVGTSTDGYSLFTSDIVSGFRYAVKQGARVVNMSFGGFGRDKALEEAIAEGIHEHGVVVVAASGNDGEDGRSYPCDMSEVIAVNASDSMNNTTRQWSDYGWRKDITAPGNYLLSTQKGNRYGVMSGTSMASPVVAAVAGLVLDARPELTPAQVRNILCATTSQKGQFMEATTAYGIVDAQKAVQAALSADASVPVESIKIKSMENMPLALTTGEELGLTALCMPATTLAPVHWQSSDPGVVTVDDYGHLKGIAPGEVTVTVSAGGKTDSRKVKVTTSVPVTSLKIRGVPKDKELEVGEELFLSARCKPANATDTSVFWEADNHRAVLMDTEGAVRAIRPGKVKITARSYDGHAKASVRIVVKPWAARLQITRSFPWMFVGEKGVFAGRLVDKAGKTKVAHGEIRWTSTNRGVASVDRKTGQVKARRPGTFFVKGCNYDGYAVAEQQVIVARKRYAGRKDYRLRQTVREKRAVTIGWRKIPVAAGYQIQQKVKTGRHTWQWKNVRFVRGSDTSAVFKGKGKKQFRIRAYYKRNKKIRYFGWSNVATAKTGKPKKKLAGKAGKGTDAGSDTTRIGKGAASATADTTTAVTTRIASAAKCRKVVREGGTASLSSRIVTAHSGSFDVLLLRGKEFKGIQDDLDLVKQLEMDALDESYMAVKKRSYYHPEVWKEINRIYRSTAKEIRKAQKIDDLIVVDSFGVGELRQDLTAKILLLEELSEVTKPVYSGKSDLPALQKNLEKDLRNHRETYPRKTFNAYYWDVFRGMCGNCQLYIKAITSPSAARKLSERGGKGKAAVKANTLHAYIKAKEKLTAFMAEEVRETLNSEMTLEEEENLEEEFEEELEEEEDLASQVPWWHLEYPDGKLYTRKAIARLRKSYIKALRLYVRDGLPVYGYKGSRKAFDGIIRSCEKDIAERQDAMSILNRVDQAFRAIDRRSGIDFKKVQEATDSSKLRMRDRMTDWFMTHYKEKNYSEDGWSKLKKILRESKAKARDAILEKQLSDSMFRRYKARLARVNTLKQEKAKAAEQGKNEATAKASAQSGKAKATA